VVLPSSRFTTAAGLATLAAAAVYAWMVTALYPFTWPALAGTVTGGVAAMAAGAAARRRGTPDRALQAKPRASNGGALVWALLLLAFAAWELAAFLQHPRPDHPTLSSLATGVFDSHATRAVAFLAWLGAGASLARR
jgi:hypothetical protein